MRITDTAVQALRYTRDRTEYYWDDNLKGFGIRASKGGNCSYILQFKIRGSTRRQTLGKSTVISAKMARQAAREVLGRKALGEDLDARPDMTVVDALEWYRDTYAYERSDQYQKMVNQMISNLFTKRVQRRLLTDMTRADWLDISEGQARKGFISSANWTEKQIKTMLNRLVERGLLASNPLAGVRNRFKTKSRDRVLSDAELRTVWDTIQTYDDRRRLALETLIITACRRSEILGLLIEEYEDGVITLSAERVKNRKPHLVTLPSYLRSQFDLFIPEHDTLFFGSDRGHLHAEHVLKTLRAETGIADFTLHDLRRTAATRMASLGVMPHIIEACLNHQMAAVGSVASVYNRYSYAKEKAEAWTLWEGFILNLP
ncbi:tyrosine-type recombinase/integrase [Ruegeria arenilitoris]|uniref:tyrosine-type recombinase/integrase n=1 Tax=Ruegeria arenilitoris TaxID=1173585 RepID=UPI00147F405C|nr:site-specific integrase [Ruegeria arenilitoris]